MNDFNRLSRKEPERIENLLKYCVNELKIGKNIDDAKVFIAWDRVSGAKDFTISKYFSQGTLYCTLSSSMVRNQLYFQRERLLSLLNEELSNEVLYTAPQDGPMVRRLVLR